MTRVRTEKQVKSWMSHPVVTIEEGVPAGEAWSLMEARDLYHLVVTRDGRPRGVVCGCEVSRAPTERSLWKIMSSPPIVILPNVHIRDAAKVIEEAQIGCLPVVSRGKIVGIVTRSDLRRAGVLPPLESSRCSSCEGTQHLRERGGVVLCVSCRERAAGDEFEEDLGEGD